MEHLAHLGFGGGSAVPMHSRRCYQNRSRPLAAAKWSGPSQSTILLRISERISRGCAYFMLSRQENSGGLLQRSSLQSQDRTSAGTEGITRSIRTGTEAQLSRGAGSVQATGRSPPRQHLQHKRAVLSAVSQCWKPNGVAPLQSAVARRLMVKEARFGWDDDFTPPPLNLHWDRDDPDWDDPVPELRRHRERSQPCQSNPRRSVRSRPSRENRRQ